MDDQHDRRHGHGWLFDKLLPQIPSVIILGALMWTRLAVLESKIEEKWAYAMDERLSLKAELAALKVQMTQLSIELTTIKATMQFWQDNSPRLREQRQRQEP